MLDVLEDVSSCRKWPLVGAEISKLWGEGSRAVMWSIKPAGGSGVIPVGAALRLDRAAGAVGVGAAPVFIGTTGGAGFGVGIEGGGPRA